MSGGSDLQHTLLVGRSDRTAKLNIKHGESEFLTGITQDVEPFPVAPFGQRLIDVLDLVGYGHVFGVGHIFITQHCQFAYGLRMLISADERVDLFDVGGKGCIAVFRLALSALQLACCQTRSFQHTGRLIIVVKGLIVVGTHTQHMEQVIVEILGIRTFSHKGLELWYLMSCKKCGIG